MHYKEMAHMIMEAGESKICRVSPQAGHPGEPMVQFQFKDGQAQEPGRADASVQM